MIVRPDRDALIILDQQLDFEPGGALAVAEGESIVGPINALAALFTEVVMTQDHHPPGHVSFASSYVGRSPFTAITLDDLLRGNVSLSESAAFTGEELTAYLEETRDGLQALWPDHCMIGTPGEDLDPHLDRSRATLVIRKGYRPSADSYSAFRENDGATTGLAECLMAKGIERVFVVGLAGDYCVLYTALDGVDAGFDVVYVEDLTRFVGAPEGSKESAYERLAETGVRVVTSGTIVQEQTEAKG